MDWLLAGLRLTREFFTYMEKLPLLVNKGETITRVNGDVSINCSKRLQIE
jgi:hypothetical protein